MVLKDAPNELPEWVKVTGLTDMVALSASGMHNLALHADGSVWTWGVAPEVDGIRNDGLPAKIPGLDHVVAVAAGRGHQLALKSDGTVWTWGMNLAGEMGTPPKLPVGNATMPDGQVNQNYVFEKVKLNTTKKPEQIKGLEKVAAMGAGDGFSIFVKTDGTVWACGVNTEGQLGTGVVDKGDYMVQPAHPEPVQVPGLEKIIRVAVADERGEHGEVHILALDADGAVWDWGIGGLGASEKALPSAGWLKRANTGAVVLNADTQQRAIPKKIWGLPKIKRIAACGRNNIALSHEGRVFVWGGGMRHGLCPRLEDEMELEQRWEMQRINSVGPNPPKLTSADSKVALRGSVVPVEIAGLERVADVAVNRDAAYALKSDGTVMAWGENTWCTLGSGKLPKEQPKAVEPVRVANLVDASAIAAAGTYALAIRGKAEDSLLKWFLEFSRILKSRTDTINRVRGAAGFIATPLAELRANNLAIIKIVQNPAKTEGVKEEAVAELRKKLARQSQEIRTHLDNLAALEREGTEAAKDIVEHLNKGFDHYGERHLQDFLRWKKRYEAMAKRLPFELAMTSGDDSHFMELAAQFQATDLPVELRVRIAKKLLSLGNIVGAYEHARAAVGAAQNDPGAKEALRDVQLVILSCALAKSDEAIGQARAAFEDYLTATGYPATDYRTVRPMHVRLLLGPLDETNRSEVWALITHGIVNTCDRVAGRLGAEELKLNATTKQMTERFLGLQLIRLLLKRGKSMEEIQELVKKADGLSSVLPLTQPDGTPYTPLQLNGLHLAILAALQVPEMKALLDPTEILQIALNKPYFDKFTVASTAIDAFGAHLVSDALLLAVPMAELYSVAGEAVTVTEFAAQLVRWNRMVTLAGGTRAGQLIFSALQKEQQLAGWLLRQELLLSFTTLKGAQLVGLFVLQKALAERAQQFGGPYAATFVQALVILSSDLSLLAKWLKAGQIETRTAERIVDRFVAEGKILQKRIETRHAEVVRMRELMKKQAAGETFTPDESEFLRARMETVPGDFIPNGSAANDAPFADKVAAEGGAQGNKKETDDILGEFENGIKQEGEELNNNLNEAGGLKGKLKTAPDPPPGPQTISYNPEKQAPGTWGPYKEPPTPTPGKNWAKGEEAMARGDYAAARQHYEEAAKANEMPDDLVDYYVTRAVEAQTASRLRMPENAAAVARTMSADIPPATAEELLVTRWNERTPLRVETPGATSTISEIPGHPDYLLKEMVPIPGKIESSHLEQMGESEVVASLLARELGIAYPATAVRFMRDAQGEVKAVRLLMRRIKGDSLNGLNSGEIYLYRTELAEGKAFAHLISDYDRKLDNFMRSLEDGRVYYLDGAMADIRSAAIGRGAPAVEFTNRGFLGIDHWYVRSYRFDGGGLRDGIKNLTPGSETFKVAVKNHLAERSLTYQDALPMVKRIHALIGDENRLRNLLTKAYETAQGVGNAKLSSFVDDAVHTLKIRDKTLDEMMRCLNQRNGIPLPEATSGRLEAPAAPRPFILPKRFDQRTVLRRAA